MQSPFQCLQLACLQDTEDEQAPPEEAQLLVVEDPIVLTDAELIQVIKVSISVKPFGKSNKRMNLLPGNKCTRMLPRL